MEYEDFDRNEPVIVESKHILELLTSYMNDCPYEQLKSLVSPKQLLHELKMRHNDFNIAYDKKAKGYIFKPADFDNFILQACLKIECDKEISKLIDEGVAELTWDHEKNDFGVRLKREKYDKDQDG